MKAKHSWQKGIERFLQQELEFELEPRKTALTLIDMQYYDAHPDYSVGLYLKEKYPETFSYYMNRLDRLVLPNQARLIEFFRQQALRIVHVMMGHSLADSSDLTPLRKARKRNYAPWREDFEHGLLEEVKPRQGELVIHKTSASAFNSSAIDQMLRNMGVECLVVAGVVTTGCVLATSLDAADRGYKTVIVEDALAGFDQKHHDAVMRIFASTFGRVVTTEEVCAELEKRQSRP